jgi:hypothetical protein
MQNINMQKNNIFKQNNNNIVIMSNELPKL